MLWKVIPKRTFVGISTLRLGTHKAVSLFNDGNIGRCLALKRLRIEPGKSFVAACKRQDIERIRSGNKAAQVMSKEAPFEKIKSPKKAGRPQWEEEEGDNPSYAAGAH